MRGESQDKHMIGEIVDLLDLLRKNHVKIDWLLEGGGRDFLLSLPGGSGFQAAYENLCFMNKMPGGVLIYYADGGGEIIYANSAVLRLFRCATMMEFREFTGNSFRGTVHPEDLEAVEKSIRERVSSSRFDLDYVEYRIRRKDGETRWIEDYRHFVGGEASRDVFYVFLSDATEKRKHRLMEKERLLQENREREQKLQTLTEEYDKERTLIRQEYLRRLEVIEGLSVDYESILYGELDTDQIRPYRLSSRTRRMFDENWQARRLGEYLSQYVAEWVHPEDRERMSKALSPAHIREKLAECSSCYINYRVLEDGEEKYLQLRMVDVSRQGRGLQIVLGYRRVDEEIRQEMKQKLFLAEALERANQAMAAKDVFLSNMSHDMRTPLNAIFGFAALARKNVPDADAVRGYLDRVEASGRQLLGMIERVLEISDSVSGQTRLEEACDLCEIIREAYDFIVPQAKEKEIDFTLDCTGVRHSGIYADAGKINQLAMYLTNNAVTYTRPGGTVRITVTEGEETLGQYASYRLVVADTGIGISREFLARIFEPFSREKDTTHSGVHGIGLGMTIARNIVDMMGGTIDVQSAVGKGSTFTANLRFRIQPAAAPEPAGGGESAPGHLQRILLVEDNAINQEIETELLEELGFSIDAADDGSIAVEKVKSSRPGDYDLILMDIQMPVMNGWQAAQAIRDLPDPALARIPIIALSANALESDIRKSAESGINAHLAKPMDVSEILKTMKELL